ncbi:unnamed protein product [Prorocentrum cordatum]|uniref:Transmembrane protein 107 n=1 Tax=Prorocentrum cordatum TaxID=2364126 RepID=A0ABN9YHH0_9DINO|nr:unnamed protein product [Polarella glacialis]
MVASAGAMWCVLDLVSAFCDEEQQRRRRDTSKARSGLAVLSWSLGDAPRDAHSQKYAPEVGKAASSLSRLRLRKPAASIGYAAVCLGALALAAGTLGREGSALRAGGLYLAGAALAAEALATVLLTCSVYGYEPSETTTSRWRAVVTAAFTAGALVWATLLRQALRSGVGASTPMAAPTAALALLHLVWPLTWLTEAPVALNFWVQWYRVQAA